MRANQARFPIAMVARLLGVSPSGYYAWRDRELSPRQQYDAVLKACIGNIHHQSRGTYGVPRIHAELAADGIHIGRKRVARLMREMNLAGVSRRKGTRTTRPGHRLRPAPDLVERRFEADAPDRLWVSDITYVPTWAGFVFLAVVVDAFSRRVVGWQVANHLRTELVLEALNMAAPAGSCRSTFGPRQPIYVVRIREALQRDGGGAVNGFGRGLLRQRDGRKLFRDP